MILTARRFDATNELTGFGTTHRCRREGRRSRGVRALLLRRGVGARLFLHAWKSPLVDSPRGRRAAHNQHMKSRVHPKYKTKYHVRNWAVYERALVRRGDVTVWLSPAAIAAWEPDTGGRRGGQRKYSDVAIETALTLRLIFHLPLRQAEGFLTSLFRLMGLDLPSPDHTTLSRRL